MNREEKEILGLTTCSHGLVHLFEGVLPPLIPLMLLEFNTNYFHLGLIVTVFSYAFGLGSLPGGIIADKIGPRRLITFYLLTAGALGIMVMWMDSLFIYGILMGLLGLAASVYHASSNALLSLKIRDVGQAFGIHGIAGSLGVSLAPVISAALGAKWGWQAPHVAFGLFGLLLGLFSLRIKDVVARGKKEATGPQGNHRLLSLFYFFTTAALLGITYKAVMTFLPSYMGERVMDFFGIPLNRVTLGGTVATIALLSGTLGQYLAGRVVGGYRGELVYLVLIVFGTFFSLIMYSARGYFLVLSAVGFSFFYFATQPVQNYLLSRYVSQARRAAGYGLHFTITFGVGSVAAALGGYLADRFGLGSVFIGSALCFALSGVFCVLLMRSQRVIE